MFFALSLRCMSAERTTRMSCRPGVELLVSTRAASRCIWMMTPAVDWSSSTRSCNWYSPSVSTPVSGSSERVRSLPNTLSSCLVVSEMTMHWSLSCICSTMPVSPVYVPLMRRTRSPTLNTLRSSSASKSTASLKSCTLGRTITLPSSRVVSTSASKFLRSPFTIMTRSPSTKWVLGATPAGRAAIKEDKSPSAPPAIWFSSAAMPQALKRCRSSSGGAPSMGVRLRITIGFSR
mmetsp:Transcript_11810/g.32182  ORF Transcript_11810/g.32182 Transcript_11810/m.32182 type:complete len:234 (+) Transcript_11810:1963-2664(+)